MAAAARRCDSQRIRPALAGEAVLGGQVLGGDAHVADAERVGQRGNHGIDHLGVAHAGAGTHRRHR
jgi:hypothetical protein